jgi:hypothetical protein
MFRDERLPTHPVHRTQSLLVGGAKAARPQVVYTQSYTWSSNRKRKQRDLIAFWKPQNHQRNRKQSCTPPGIVYTQSYTWSSKNRKRKQRDLMAFWKLQNHQRKRKQSCTPPGIVYTLHSPTRGPQTGKGNRETWKLFESYIVFIGKEKKKWIPGGAAT